MSEHDCGSVKHFPFYRSFKEALEDLDDNQRLSLYDGLTDFAFYGKEYQPIDTATSVVYKLCKPNILTALKKIKGGSQRASLKEESAEEKSQRHDELLKQVGR